MQAVCSPAYHREVDVRLWVLPVFLGTRVRLESGREALGVGDRLHAREDQYTHPSRARDLAQLTGCAHQKHPGV